VPFIAVRTGEVPDDTLRKAGSVEVFDDIGTLFAWLKKLLLWPIEVILQRKLSV
jgi:hypothetical protein